MQYFEITGISRKPNSWDRENLANWRKWNFSDEMILEAAKRSAGISNPIPYMNAILSRWKNSGIYGIPDIKDNAFEKQGKTANAKHFANERSYTKEDLDKLVSTFDDLDI
jgi:DNA replication protein DnaD